MIKMHDIQTCHSIKWENKKDGFYVRDYFMPLLADGSTSIIGNVNTKTYLLELDNIVLPFTVNDDEFDNSYVCSPFTHYVTYAKEELWELHNPLLEKLLLPFINMLGYYLKRNNINKVVMVNNWLLSTNLYHHLTKQQIKEITLFLTKEFPEHTVMFRSLNKKLYPEMFDSFSQLEYTRCFSRSVYLFYPDRIQSVNWKVRQKIKTDLKLLKNSGYEVIENKDICENDKKVIENLYNKLYIDKYSDKNPLFKQSFYQNAIKNNLFHFKALKKGNQIDGVIGYFVRDGVMTAPIVGYNTSLDKNSGLYRMLSILLTYASLDNNYILHGSAGAGQFKRTRGAEQELEYSFIYYQHLSKKRQKVWKTLQKILDKIIEPMAKKYNF